MLVLGIESSCDETAAAIVADGAHILSNVVASQVPIHEKYGGVVPELASREHLRRITPVVEEACYRAGVCLPALDGIAVTQGPGLIGSLLVGLVYGKALALSLGKPLVGVNHLEGHIHAVLLENVRPPERRTFASGERLLEQASDTALPPEPAFPCVTLVVSGGHTSLFRVDQHRKPGHTALFCYELLGRTRDDAAGEAFDKVAKLLALGYPGGPIIDQLAPFGNPHSLELGRVRMRGNPLDFSFSGLKTAVLYRVRGTPLSAEAESRREWQKAAGRVSVAELRSWCSRETLDLIASFQNAVVTDLVERTFTAAAKAEPCGKRSAASIFVSGGVACNSLLRQRFQEASNQHAINVFFPSPKLSTDNAAMIAAAGYYKLMAGERAGHLLTAQATLPLGMPSQAEAR